MTLERVKELAGKLAPVIGAQAQRLVDAWLVEDMDGRREVETLLELEFRKYFKDGQVNLPPPEQGLSIDGSLRIGHVVHRGEKQFPFTLSKQELLRHSLIAGASGTGKTTLIYHFALELLRERVPFFIFDFKLDFRPLCKVSKDLTVFTIGEGVNPFPFNPLAELSLLCQARSGLHDLNPLYQLSDVLTRVFYCGHGVRSILNAAFAHLARQWAQHDFKPEYTPDFRKCLAWLRDYEPESMKGLRFKEWKVSTVRVLEQLATGSFGDAIAVDTNQHQRMRWLRDQTIIFELSTLPEDLKRFFVEALLLCMRHAALEGVKEAKPGEQGSLRNVMIIDEAHNLLRKHEEAIESQLSLALREHRGLGTAYIISDQTPSQTDDSAITNTHTKFFFALDNAKDIRVASQSLLLKDDEKDWLAKLPTGQCIARNGTKDAFLIQLDSVDHIKNVPVSDQEIAKNKGQNARDSTFSTLERVRNGQQRSKQPPTLPDERGKTAEPALTEAERRVLESVLSQPFAGVNNHYRKAGLSTRNGQQAIQSLESKGLITIHEVKKEYPGGGKIIILEITSIAAELLRKFGHQAWHPYYQASPEHEYWKDQASQHYKAQGYTVEKEHPVNGGHVDLHAERHGQKVAVEVETGKSRPADNVQKALKAGYDKVISLATNTQAAEHAKLDLTAASIDDERVSVATVASLRPTPHDWLARYFTLPGPEKLLLAEMLDHDGKSPVELETIMARSRVPPERTREAVLALLDAGFLREKDDALSLAPLTMDAFKLMGVGLTQSLREDD